MFVNSANAATYYVSQVATNGYVIGSDSNNGLTKGTAKLTISSAITASSAGDTIYLNDGTYDYTTGVLSISKGISLQSETDYGAIITNNGGLAYVVGLTAGITGTVTLGKIVITEKAANTNLLYLFAPTIKHPIVINGTKFLDYHKVAIFIGNTVSFDADIDLTIQNAIFNSSVMLQSGGYYVIDGRNLRNGDILIDNNTFTNSTSVSANGRYDIAITKNGDNSTVTISNNTINDNTVGGSLYGIYVKAPALTNTSFSISGNTFTMGNSISGFSNAIYFQGTNTASVAPVIASNSMTLTGSSNAGTVRGIYTIDVNSVIRNNTLSINSDVSSDAIWADVISDVLCNSIKVYGNNLTISSPGGHGIIVGNEVTGSRSTYLTDPQIYSNTIISSENVTTTIHGIMFGYIKNGLGWNNYSSGNNIDYIIKGSLDTTFLNNIAVNPTSVGGATGQALRMKGANNGQFINNTVINTNASRNGSDVPFYADADTADSTGSYINNSVYSNKNFLDYVYVQSSSIISFSNNNYYGSNINFNYSNTVYSTILSWQDAKESTASVADPNFLNINSSYALTSTSTLIDAGTSNGLTSTTTDYLGNPIYGTPDIGAYEYQPPFTIGVSLVDPTGNIRIYGDGKYRYTTATSSTMSANLSVTPAETWTYQASTTRPEWLNISNITWGSTKQWTASSTMATTTIYTVGDLTSGSTYTITLDGSATTTITSSSCSDNICTANSEGKITFTYTGGYSTHTFAVSPYTAPTPTPTTAPISSGSSAQSRISNLISMGLYNQAQQIAKQYNIPLPSNIPAKTTPPTTFTRTLRQGMIGNDVKALQQFLNSKGFIVSKTGPGSPNKETNYFGPATRSALMKFQQYYKKEILDPQNLKAPTGIFGEGTRRIVNSIW